MSHCLFTSTSRRKRNRNLKAYPGPEPFTPLRWCEDARIDLVGSSTFFFCLVELSWKQVQAIKAFRGSRAPPGNRKILQCAITTYGNDFGDSQQHGGLEMSWNKKPLDSFWPLYPVSLSYQQVTNLEFQRDGSTRIGRQSQTWLSVLLATLQLKLKTEEIVVWNRFHFVVAFELSPVRNARRVEGDFRSRIHYGVTRVDTGVSKTKCLWISTFAILRVWNLKKHHSKVNVPRGVVSFPSGIYRCETMQKMESSEASEAKVQILWTSEIMALCWGKLLLSRFTEIDGGACGSNLKRAWLNIVTTHSHISSDEAKSKQSKQSKLLKSNICPFRRIQPFQVTPKGSYFGAFGSPCLLSRKMQGQWE